MDAKSPWHVRGPSYLETRKKILSRPAILDARAVQIFSSIPSMACIEHVSQKNFSWLGLQRQKLGAESLPFFTLCIQLVLPDRKGFLRSFCFYWTEPQKECEMHDNGSTLYKALKFGSDSFLRERLKIIPGLHGNALIARMVGNRPSILGSKLKTTYYRSPNSLEALIDVSSFKFARSAASLALRVSESLIVDLAFVLEAKEAHELPERVLCAISLIHIGPHDGILWTSLGDFDSRRKSAEKGCTLSQEKGKTIMTSTAQARQSVRMSQTYAVRHNDLSHEFDVFLAKLRSAFSFLQGVKNALSY